MKRKTIPLTDETHRLLAVYAKKHGRYISHVGDRIIRSFLETQHDLVKSKGEMIIEGEEQRPKTIVKILEEDREERKPRRLSLKDIEIVRKGNRYIVKKKRG